LNVFTASVEATWVPDRLGTFGGGVAPRGGGAEALAAVAGLEVAPGTADPLAPGVAGPFVALAVEAKKPLEPLLPPQPLEPAARARRTLPRKSGRATAAARARAFVRATGRLRISPESSSGERLA
jgi:hypothetical protein